MASDAPVAVLYTREVLSADALTSLAPVKSKHTSRISSVCPRSV